MEIGVVVHGPGIIDSGYALKIIDLLSNYGNVHCRLGGTMGRTAVIDASLEDRIDISLKLLPSESLELYNRENLDVIFLLNYGKSAVTGHVFGYNVFTHYFKKISNEDFLATNHKPLYDSKIPVIQIERPGEDDGSIISWNVVLNRQLRIYNKNKNPLSIFKKDMVGALTFNFEEFFYGIAKELDLEVVDPEDIDSKYFSDSIEKSDESNIQKIIKSYPSYDESKFYTYRKIYGSSPGENIFVNAIVIGYARSEEMILVAEDGIIIDIVGGEIKSHGVEKLGPVNLKDVVVKTGLLRKSDEVVPRIIEKEQVHVADTERNIWSEGLSGDDSSFKVGFVDHAAYDIYRFKDFDLVISIGDDTTLVSSDILYRFNIPILGITDGDLDKVVEKGFVNEKSTIIEVASGFDDIVGHHIHKEIFESNQILEIPFTDEYDSFEEFKSVMLAIVKSHVLESVKSVVPSFIERNYLYEVVGSFSLSAVDDEGIDELSQEIIDDLEYEDSFEEEIDEDLKEKIENMDNEEDVIYVEHDIDEVSELEPVDSELEPVDSDFDSVDSGFESVDDLALNDSLVDSDFESVVEDSTLEETAVEDADEEQSFAEFVEEISSAYEEEPLESDIEVVSYESDISAESEESDVDEGSDGSDVVYVDSEGNEVVYEEGVVYIDSNGEEITSDIEDLSKLNSEELEKYNNILEDCVNDFQESFDDEYSDDSEHDD